MVMESIDSCTRVVPVDCLAGTEYDQYYVFCLDKYAQLYDDAADIVAKKFEEFDKLGTTKTQGKR